MKKLFFATICAIFSFGLFVNASNSVTPAVSYFASNSTRYFNGDPQYELIRENVPYCSSRNTCDGYGCIVKNTKTGQLGFGLYTSGGHVVIDLSRSSEMRGYTHRFYYKGKYRYVSYN